MEQVFQQPEQLPQEVGEVLVLIIQLQLLPLLPMQPSVSLFRQIQAIAFLFPLLTSITDGLQQVLPMVCCNISWAPVHSLILLP